MPSFSSSMQKFRKDLKHHGLVALKLTLHHDSDRAAEKDRCSSVIYLLGQPEARGFLGKSFKVSFWPLILRISRNANETQHKSEHLQVLFLL